MGPGTVWEAWAGLWAEVIWWACFPRMHQTNNARFLDLLWRHVLSLGLLAAAFLVSYSRYGGGRAPVCTLPVWCPADPGPSGTPPWTLVPEPVGQDWKRGPRPLVLKGQGSSCPF